MSKKTIMLTHNDFTSVIARGAIIHQGRATLRLIREEGSGDRRFMMEGPSGKHSLLYDATDLDRLNAHWVTFASDYRNVIE